MITLASDVKWIKITTDIFDDDKILLIESLPEADSIIVIWFKLLCLAGKQNNSGVFVMGNRIPYTDKMLATIFRRKESTVQLALQTFEQFGMVEIIDGVITIPNWGKHQNLDQLESKKEYMRNYMKDYRQKQKQKALLTENTIKTACKNNGKTNSKANVSSADKEREIDKERDIKRESNSKLLNSEEPSPAEPPKESAPSLYGIYQNVFLSDSEYITLQEEFPLDYDKQIDKLSTYMKGTGKSYDSHFAMIRKWASEDMAKAKTTNNRSFRGSQVVDNFDDIYEVGGSDQEPKQIPTEEDKASSNHSGRGIGRSKKGVEE